MVGIIMKTMTLFLMLLILRCWGKWNLEANALLPAGVFSC